jgi:hypothetical protein
MDLYNNHYLYGVIYLWAFVANMSVWLLICMGVLV